MFVAVVAKVEAGTSGPESQTFTLRAPVCTGIETSTVPVSLTVLKRPCLRTKENGLRRRIWSLTATIKCPSETGESKRSRRTGMLEEAWTGAGTAVGGVSPVFLAMTAVGFFAATTGGFEAFFFAAASASAIFAA